MVQRVTTVQEVPGEGEVGGGVPTTADQLHQAGGGGGVEHAGGRVEDSHRDLSAEICHCFSNIIIIINTIIIILLGAKGDLPHTLSFYTTKLNRSIIIFAGWFWYLCLCVFTE